MAQRADCSIEACCVDFELQHMQSFSSFVFHQKQVRGHTFITKGDQIRIEIADIKFHKLTRVYPNLA